MEAGHDDNIYILWGRADERTSGRADERTSGRGRTALFWARVPGTHPGTHPQFSWARTWARTRNFPRARAFSSRCTFQKEPNGENGEGRHTHGDGDDDGGDGVRWKTPPAGQTGWTAYSGSSGRSMKLSAMHQASAVGVE